MPQAVYYASLIHTYAVANLTVATVNLAIRSVFVPLRVVNGHVRDAIGQLWLRFGSVCKDFLTLRFVKHGVWKMYRRIRYFLNRAGVRNQRLADGLKGITVRFKPYEEKVKKMLIFFVTF